MGMTTVVLTAVRMVDKMVKTRVVETVAVMAGKMVGTMAVRMGVDSVVSSDR